MPPDLFTALNLAGSIDHNVADIRDRENLTAAMRSARPSVVFHLAAQAIVLAGYADPSTTYETNVMGTVNLLEAVRACDSVEAVVVVTSDKCYQNLENGRPFRETDPMGGHDPYSSSKACAELITSAYRSSFFAPDEKGEAARVPAVASVRAGNVIGGGDWAADRIIPDCARALSAGAPLVVRNPAALRPWQHVLEPLSGYLWLGALMLRDPRAYNEAWNFGPVSSDSTRDVRWVVERFLQEWGGGEWTTPPAGRAKPREAGLLSLDSTKATERLGWRPVWEASQAVRHTAAWYRDYYRLLGKEPGSAAGAQALKELTADQLAGYERDARAAGLAWAVPQDNEARPRR
jgi:CDP-glucose 4,6-dehydratase